MGRLDGITLEELHEIREQTEGGKPRERVHDDPAPFQEAGDVRQVGETLIVDE